MGETREACMAAFALGLALLLFMVLPAHALTLTFKAILPDDPATAATVAPQLTADVQAEGANQVKFTFFNSGPVPASITDVYFDDGTLFGINYVVNGAGVTFSHLGTVSPSQLPHDSDLTPKFETSQGFRADSDSPTVLNGVDPGETLAIVFDLLPGKTFADTIISLGLCCHEPEWLRIGLHVQAISGPDGGSESFVNNPVPEPGTIFLLGTGLVGVATWARRRLSQQG
jgi:hypothetical protein